MEKDTPLLAWKAYTRYHKERKIDWYWAIAIIGIAGSVLAFLFGNFFFGVFIILAIVFLFYSASQKNELVPHTIFETGIKIGNEMLHFEKMKGFWIDENEEWGKLMIHTKSPINPIVVVYFENKDFAPDIYDIFKDKVEETYLTEPISHQIFEKLGL